MARIKPTKPGEVKARQHLEAYTEDEVPAEAEPESRETRGILQNHNESRQTRWAGNNHNESRQTRWDANNHNESRARR